MKTVRLLSFVFLLTAVLFGWQLGQRGTVQAYTFTVNTTVDEIDASPGDGLCLTIVGTCSLRAAVQEVNALGGGTIVVPPGFYQLSVTGDDTKGFESGHDFYSFMRHKYICVGEPNVKCKTYLRRLPIADIPLCKWPLNRPRYLEAIVNALARSRVHEGAGMENPTDVTSTMDRCAGASVPTSSASAPRTSAASMASRHRARSQAVRRWLSAETHGLHCRFA